MPYAFHLSHTARIPVSPVYGTQPQTPQRKGAVVSHRPRSGEVRRRRKAYQLNEVPSVIRLDVTLLLKALPVGVAAVTPWPVMKLKPFCFRSLYR